MIPVFADTSFYVALVSPRDALHARAVEVAGQLSGPILTTGFVLVEVGNFLCRMPENRAVFYAMVHDLLASAQVEVLPASDDLFTAGLELLHRRPDKEWSLTDCISFHVMAERGVVDALTSDHHFTQAGFRILLT